MYVWNPALPKFPSVILFYAVPGMGQNVSKFLSFRRQSSFLEKNHQKWSQAWHLIIKNISLQMMMIRALSGQCCCSLSWSNHLKFYVSSWVIEDMRSHVGKVKDRWEGIGQCQSFCNTYAIFITVLYDQNEEKFWCLLFNPNSQKDRLWPANVILSCLHR